MSFAEIIGRFCFARACTAKREDAYLMCRQHWAMVPPQLQQKVIRAMGAYEKDPRAPGRKHSLHMAMGAARIAVDEAERRADRAERAAARARR